MRQRLTFPALWTLALLAPWAAYSFAVDAFQWKDTPPFTSMAELRTYLFLAVSRPALFAAAQWLVLRGRVRWAVEWPLTSALAGSLSVTLALGEFRAGPSLPWSASLGAAVVSYGVALLPSLAEWLLLERHSRHAWVWLAMAASWMPARQWMRPLLRGIVDSAGLPGSVGVGVEYVASGLIAGSVLQWILLNQLRESRQLTIVAAGQRALMWAGASAIVWQAGLILGGYGWGFAAAALQTPVLALVMRKRALWWIPASLIGGALPVMLGPFGLPPGPIISLGALQTTALLPSCGPRSLVWLASTACVVVLTLTISPSYLPFAGISGLTAGYLMHVAERRHQLRTKEDQGAAQQRDEADER